MKGFGKGPGRRGGGGGGRAFVPMRAMSHTTPKAITPSFVKPALAPALGPGPGPGPHHPHRRRRYWGGRGWWPRGWWGYWDYAVCVIDVFTRTGALYETFGATDEGYAMAIGTVRFLGGGRIFLRCDGSRMELPQ